MAFADLADSGYSLRKGPYRVVEAAIAVHQNKKSDGTATPPFTAGYVRWQPLTDDLQDDGEPKERHYSLAFKRNTEFFLPSEDDKTAAGSAVGSSGKYYVALKSDTPNPDAKSEFGTLLSSLLNAGMDVGKLNASGMQALVGMVVDVDQQSREGKVDATTGVKPVYHSDIVVKIHTVAAAPVKAVAKAGAAKAAPAAAPAAAAAAVVPSDFDGDTWLLETLTELQAKFTGQTKQAVMITGQLKVNANKNPVSKDWVAKQAAGNADFWHGVLVDNGIGVVDGKQVTFA